MQFIFKGALSVQILCICEKAYQVRQLLHDIINEGITVNPAVCSEACFFFCFSPVPSSLNEHTKASRLGKQGSIIHLSAYWRAARLSFTPRARLRQHAHLLALPHLTKSHLDKRAPAHSRALMGKCKTRDEADRVTDDELETHSKLYRTERSNSWTATCSRYW